MLNRVASKASWLVLGCGFVAALPACSSGDEDRSGGGGASPGGASNAGASAGAGGENAGGPTGGASNSGPFTCGMGKANCDSWTTFSQATTTSWGAGTFSGGVTTFGAKLKRDSATSAIHVTGTVDDYGYGVGLFFLNCSDLSAYTGVSFALSGSAGIANTMIFQVQTNADYPWEAKPADEKGACTAVDKANPFGSCVAPSKTVPLADGSVLWSELAGGMPTATASANEALGLQWAFPYDGETSYDFDVTVSDVKLLGGTGVSCTASAGGGSGGAPGSAEAGAAGAP